MQQETPQWIGQNRMVLASSLLAGRVDLRGYPYPYVAVMATGFLSSARVTAALAAAELLRPAGWELVNVALDEAGPVYAILRRAAGAP